MSSNDVGGGVNALCENSWYVASWSDDLAIGAPMAVQILGEPIVLWRAPSHHVSALIDRCPHWSALEKLVQF